MASDRRDPLEAPENPTPPRERAEAERRIAWADQAIERLRRDIRDYKYKYQQRERFCAPRLAAIHLWEREKGICRDFLRAQPNPRPAPPPAPAAPPPPLEPDAIPAPVADAVGRVYDELALQVTAAQHRNPRLGSVSISLEVIRGLMALLEPLRQHHGNVSPLRQRAG